jgi:hypothetical protein
LYLTDIVAIATFIAITPAMTNMDCGTVSSREQHNIKSAQHLATIDYTKHFAMPILRAKIIALFYAFSIDNNKSKYYVKFKLTKAGGNMAMTILKKDLKKQIGNVMLRVSIPAPLRAEIRRTKKICANNGFYFDIKSDVIGAVEKAVAEAKERLDSEKKNRADNSTESEAQTPAQSSDGFAAAAPHEG